MTLTKLPASLPGQTRAAAGAPGKVDAEKRTVEVVFATETPVRRKRYEGYDKIIDFDEILTVSRAGIDLSRLNVGAPVLDTHSRYSTTSIVGVVEKAWIDGKDARALLRFPALGIDENADRLFALISDGIVRNVSVGYTLEKIKIVEPKKAGDVQQVIATRWAPFEISFVAVPADPASGVRSEDGKQLFTLQTERNPAAIAARMRMRMAQF